MRGDSAADGYWNQRAKSRRTFEGEWTRTGDTYLRDADWHLFVGDETALPAIFAMLDGLRAPAHVFRMQHAVEVEKEHVAACGDRRWDDRQWLHIVDFGCSKACALATRSTSITTPSSPTAW